MDFDAHNLHVGVRELDLSACHVNTFSDTINAVPGLKTSTAFFTFLRANLVLSPSAMSSCANTPILDAAVPMQPSLSFQPTSPSPLAVNPPLTPDDDIPPLSLEPLDTAVEKAEGLKLVADSVAQMQQHAAKNAIKHPLSLAGMSLTAAVAYQITGKDVGLGLVLSCGIIMSYFMAVRWMSSRYVTQAENLRYDWLRNPETSAEDIVFGAKCEDTLVGALVLRLQPCYTFPSNNGRRKKSGSVTLKGGRGIIRAWTTDLKYRGTGVGKDLLFEAVRFTKEKCGRDAEVGFAQEHANSLMVMPRVFNGGFRKDEVRAARALEEALAEWDICKRKR
ncbi:uncharacterized protein J7T54_007065 [Emericellopsis cladophorae]|uniref:N-acetyltransferase domain-containing protein n=1 Tax=Emericellopsis cladophorae TaxID=2686198 RepID=A0A9P9Y974_9HYPO|nr:uncharacterized protein J7T54_007065 [Emericellopsis cladophorae]KAI6785423.1 hypothetical protein J7T54_007065 [Emericellopsis cladophorae]